MPKKPIRHPFFSQEHDAWAVPLTQGVIALVDEDVVKLLGAKNWYAQIISRSWYATRHVDWRREIKIMMHTEILGTRRGYEIDHRINYPLDQFAALHETKEQRQSETKEQRNSPLQGY